VGKEKCPPSVVVSIWHHVANEPRVSVHAPAILIFLERKHLMNANDYITCVELNLKHCRDKINLIMDHIKGHPSVINTSDRAKAKLASELDFSLGAAIRDLRSALNNGTPTNGDFYADRLLPDMVEIIKMDQFTESARSKEIAELKMADCNNEDGIFGGRAFKAKVSRRCSPPWGNVWYIEDHDTGKLVKWRANYDSSD